MKGTLTKIGNVWVIKHWIKDPCFHGMPGRTCSEIVELLPLHPDETDMDSLTLNPEGKEVEFEIEEVYIEPEGIHCNRGGFKKYAVIVEPEDIWDDIQDKATKDGVDIPIGWFKERYNVPIKKN